MADLTSLRNAHTILHNTKWDHINNYNCMFIFSNKYSKLGIPAALNTSKVRLESNEEEVYMNSVAVPQLGSSSLEKYIDHRYFETFDKTNSMDIDIKFTDHDDFSLYRFFTSYIFAQRLAYPEEYYFDLVISNILDHTNAGKLSPLIRYTNCMIQSIGNLDFNNTLASDVFASFNVQIKSPKYELLYKNDAISSNCQ